MSKNESFEKNGYLYIPNLIKNPENFFEYPPIDENGQKITGQISYISKDKIVFNPIEKQVNGSFARYNVPVYEELYYFTKKQIEKILNIKLLPTYYFDRFYFVGQELEKHKDRLACEISVSVQISTNRKNPWPIWFEKPDGSEDFVIMKNGDAVIYKGCERAHWRNPLPSRYDETEKKKKNKKIAFDDTYHHQIFFHYMNTQTSFVYQNIKNCEVV